MPGSKCVRCRKDWARHSRRSSEMRSRRQYSSRYRSRSASVSVNGSFGAVFTTAGAGGATGAVSISKAAVPGIDDLSENVVQRFGQSPLRVVTAEASQVADVADVVAFPVFIDVLVLHLLAR